MLRVGAAERLAYRCPGCAGEAPPTRRCASSPAPRTACPNRAPRGAGRPPTRGNARGQPPDVAVDRLRGGDRAEVEVGVDRLRIHRRCRSRQRQRDADAGPEGDPLGRRRVVEAPDAEAVGGQDETTRARPPERQREGPAKRRKKRAAVAAIAVLENADRRHDLRGAADLVQIGQVEVRDGGRVVSTGLHAACSPSAARRAPGSAIRSARRSARGSDWRPRERRPGFDRARRIAIDEAADDAHAGLPSRRSFRIAGTARASTA